MQNQLTEIIKVTEEAVTAVAPDLSLVEAKFGQQGKRRSLEVTIHRRGGRISLDDCEHVSRKLEELLDAQNPPIIDNASYVLEVQSPGLDRPLKTERDFNAFAGESVEIKTKEPIDSLGCEFSGNLNKFDGSQVEITSPCRLQAPTNKAKQKSKSSKNQDAAPLPASVSIELTKISQIRRYALQAIAPDQVTSLSEESVLTIE